jgi:hypothetical protein
VGEEVRSVGEIAGEAGAQGIRIDVAKDPELAALNNWCHRRVFTRLIKNVNAGRYDLGYLKPPLAELHRFYVETAGGRLTLEEILERTFNGLYSSVIRSSPHEQRQSEGSRTSLDGDRRGLR